MKMVEVKVSELSGAALDYAYEAATGIKASQSVAMLPQFAQFIIFDKVGDTVSVPAELVECGQ